MISATESGFAGAPRKRVDADPAAVVTRLIWSAPATPVFIDGRLTPYRASGVLEEYRTVIGLRPG
jgi:hypothetical protein